MNRLTQGESEEVKRATELPVQVVSDAAAEVAETAEEQLARLEASRLGYSSQAFKSFRKLVGDYISDLANEAAREAKRHNADTVSRSHVERASERLVSGSVKRRAQHFGTIGGLLLGAAISYFLTMIGTPRTEWNLAGILAAVALAILGAFMIAYQMAND